MAYALAADSFEEGRDDQKRRGESGTLDRHTDGGGRELRQEKREVAQGVRKALSAEPT